MNETLDPGRPEPAQPLSNADVDRALQLADDHGLVSIAFPALGTGVGGLEIDACAAAMVQAVHEHLKRGSSLRRIVFVVRGADLVSQLPRAEVFRREIAKAFGEHR